jgi:hypothetical protein
VGSGSGVDNKGGFNCVCKKLTMSITVVISRPSLTSYSHTQYLCMVSNTGGITSHKQSRSILIVNRFDSVCYSDNVTENHDVVYQLDLQLSIAGLFMT